MIVQAIKEASRDTFLYSGRSERLEHWAFLLFTAICVAVFQSLAIFGIAQISPLNWIFLILFCWLILANISLMVRRLHDHGLSGFWLLLPLIPFGMMLIAAKTLYGTAFTFMTFEDGETLMKVSQAGMVSVAILFGSLFVRPGSKKSNRYGGPIL